MCKREREKKIIKQILIDQTQKNKLQHFIFIHIQYMKETTTFHIHTYTINDDKDYSQAIYANRRRKHWIVDVIPIAVLLSFSVYTTYVIFNPFVPSLLTFVVMRLWRTIGYEKLNVFCHSNNLLGNIWQ